MEFEATKYPIPVLVSAASFIQKKPQMATTNTPPKNTDVASRKGSLIERFQNQLDEQDIQIKENKKAIEDLKLSNTRIETEQKSSKTTMEDIQAKLLESSAANLIIMGKLDELLGKKQQTPPAPIVTTVTTSTPTATPTQALVTTPTITLVPASTVATGSNTAITTITTANVSPVITPSIQPADQAQPKLMSSLLVVAEETETAEKQMQKETTMDTNKNPRYEEISSDEADAQDSMPKLEEIQKTKSPLSKPVKRKRIFKESQQPAAKKQKVVQRKITARQQERDNFTTAILHIPQWLPHYICPITYIVVKFFWVHEETAFQLKTVIGNERGQANSSYRSHFHRIGHQAAQTFDNDAKQKFDEQKHPTTVSILPWYQKHQKRWSRANIHPKTSYHSIRQFKLKTSTDFIENFLAQISGKFTIITYIYNKRIIMAKFEND